MAKFIIKTILLHISNNVVFYGLAKVLFTYKFLSNFGVTTNNQNEKG